MKAPVQLFAVLIPALFCGAATAQAGFTPVFSVAPMVAAASGVPALEPTVSPTPYEAVSSSSALSASELPDAPAPTITNLDMVPMEFAIQSQSLGTAPKHDKTILAGWTAQKLTAWDKVIVGAKDLYSPLNFLSMPLSAGYSHLTNGQPNYGTNSQAYGKRVGAAAVRETSQGIFTDMIFSPLLHEDPRYYVKGPSHSYLNRGLYAATRPIIGRTDAGHSTVNAALLLGYAGAAALTHTYYPDINRNFHDMAATFGGSLGGAAIGFVFTEFTDDLLRLAHVRK